MSQHRLKIFCRCQSIVDKTRGDCLSRQSPLRSEFLCEQSRLLTGSKAGLIYRSRQFAHKNRVSDPDFLGEVVKLLVDLLADCEIDITNVIVTGHGNLRAGSSRMGSDAGCGAEEDGKSHAQHAKV